jgi:hypothetical protein
MIHTEATKTKTNKRYIAMCRFTRIIKDDNGRPILHDGHYQRETAPGYKPFGTNGKVVSLYDSAAKAARYCGKNGYVIEMDPADCRKVGASIAEQQRHCEERMLFWGKEADRLLALVPCELIE